MMPKKPPSSLQRDISARLRAIQTEMGATDACMAEMVGTSRSVWTNWLGMANLPDEHAMVVLCSKAGVTMDWLYRGLMSAHMPVKLAIRLEARLIGLDPDAAEASEMAPLALRILAPREPD